MLAFFFSLLAWIFPLYPLSSEHRHKSKSHEADELQLGSMWTRVQYLEENDLLYEMIRERRAEIFKQKEHWKEKLQSGQNSSLHKQVEKALATGALVPSSSGSGAAYILYDQKKLPAFVLKPVDEDLLCLNNRKGFSSPYHHPAFRPRFEIPLYRSPQTEALSYQFAKLLNLTHLTPETSLAILSSSLFHDLSKCLDDPSRQRAFWGKSGFPDFEKLCSVQRFLPHQQTLFHLMQQWTDQGLSEEEIFEQIDQRDFEDLMLFIWCIYDTDAHVGNFPVIKDQEGLYHLKKIDHGLAFPNKNSHFFNILYFLPHANLPISPLLQQKIAELPTEHMIAWIHYFEMEDCLNAFQERILVLQELSKRSRFTFCEIETRLRALELPNGKDIALGNFPFSELEVKKVKTKNL